MKNIVFFLSILLLISCDSQSNDSKSGQQILPGESGIISIPLVESGVSYTWSVGASGSEGDMTLVSTASDSHNLKYKIQAISANTIEVTYSFQRLSTQLVNKQHKIQLLEQGAIVAETTVNLFDIPRMAELNWPQRNLFTSKPMVENIVDRNNLNFYWLNLPDWQLPEDPNWQENPYDNISWQMFYVSLGWLTSIGHHYKSTGKQSDLTLIESYLIDFDETFKDIDNTSFPLIYREDAVSIRTNHLLYLYLNFKENLSSAALTALINQLDNHFIKLTEYVTDPGYDSENHGLIQARSGLNLAASLPQSSYADNLRDASLSRIGKASINMYSQNFSLSIEQAVDYHFVGIAMFLEAKEQIEQLGLEAPSSLVRMLENAILTGAYFLYSDNTVPAIGDSYYDGQWLFNIKRYYEYLGVYIEQVERFLADGLSALDDSYFIEEEGLFIGKRELNSKFDKFFFDFGKPRFVHGHFDNMNIVAELASKKLLIDSGGPYTYTYQGRTNFWSKFSQNNLAINARYLSNGPTEFNYLEENVNTTTLQATESVDNVNHTRTLIYNNHLPHSLMVFDYVDTNSTVEEYWHFPPKTKLETIEPGTNKVILADGSVFYHYKRELQASNCRVREGEFDSTNTPLIGWVSRGYNLLDKAPVQYCKSVNSKYVAVNLFTTTKLSSHSFVLQRLNQGYVIDLLDFQFRFDSNLMSYFLDDFPNDPDEWRDSDGDGIGNNLDDDDDNDGIDDQKELSLGLNPYQRDTDGDGIDDADEIKNGSDPLVFDEDSDNDGFSNKEEVEAGTNPYDDMDVPVATLPWLNVLYSEL